MRVTVKIPTQLRQLVGGAAQVEVESVTDVRDLLEKLGQKHQELVERIVDESGEIRRFVNVYVGDEDVRFLKGLDTELQDQAVISILPAVAGGS